MDNERLQKFIGTEEITVVDAMQKIGKNVKGILYIIDSEGRLIGSLTDGDIRRWIIRTGDLSGKAFQMMCREPKFLFEGDLGMAVDFFKRNSINSIPILNNERKIIDIIFNDYNQIDRVKINSKALVDVPVIVMAGGKGTRLYPYTKILPKPLIPIGDVPILERILNRFHMFGAAEFYLTVNYKKEMIKSYFNELQLPYTIHYVEEDKPLGTAGSIKLIKERFDKPIIITNCDILIEADYEKVLRYHRDSGNELTIVSALKNTTIPYGVLHSQENGIITHIEEKPKLSYFINTGMYIVNPDQLQKIPEDTVFHMTHLAERLMSEGLKVGMYPISENSFLDMGEFEEMKRMEEMLMKKEV